MSHIFTAHFAYSEDDGETMTAGLADSQFETSKYVTFQRSHKVSEQDKRLGMEGVYIEVNDQIHSSYGGLRAIYLSRDRLEVHLEAKAAESMRLPIQVCVGLPPDVPNLSAFVDLLSKMQPESVHDKRIYGR